MNQLKLEVVDLFKAIEYFAKIKSTGDTIDNLSQSPAHMLLYNEILRYSKEELEACKHPRPRGGNLYDHIFSNENRLFFTALLKTGAFHNRLNEHSKWLLSVASKPSNALFETIYSIEKKYSVKDFNGTRKKMTHAEFIDVLVRTYLSYPNKIDNRSEKFQIMDKYLEQFGNLYSNEVTNAVAHNYRASNSDIYDHIIFKLKELNVDLSKNNYLNNYLPKDEKDVQFFISSIYDEKISKFLEHGFRFDEKNYSFNGCNLFMAIIKGSREDLCEIILPYLTDLTPRQGTWEEQHAYIESLPGKSLYLKKFIKSTYEKCLLDNLLPANNSTDKKKIKL